MAEQLVGGQRWGRAAVLLVVASAGFFTFARSWDHPFVYDDRLAVGAHPLLKADSPWTKIFVEPYWPRDASPDPLYRPVTMLSFRLNGFLLGRDPAGFLVVNSLLHALTCCVIALLAATLWRRESAGLIAGLLFATHPVHAEAVVPVVGRSEILALLFMVTMLTMHVRRVSRTNRPSAVYHVVLSLCYLLAMGSKEQGVMALPLIGLIDVWAIQTHSNWSCRMRERIRRVGASHYIGLIFSLALFMLMRWVVFGWQTSLPDTVSNSTRNPLEIATVVQRIATPFELVTLAMQLICLPVNLCPIWGKGAVDLATSLTSLSVLAGVAIVALLVTALIVMIREGRNTSFLLAGLLLFLVIPCHFVSAAAWFFAERWLYAPSAMVILFVAGVSRLAPRAAVAATIMIASAFALVSWDYQESWRSDEQLVRSSIERKPRNYLALNGLCNLLTERGDEELAAPYIDRLIRFHPDEGETWLYLAKLQASRGQYKAAMSSMDRYVEIAGLPGLTPDVSTFRKGVLRSLREQGP